MPLDYLPILAERAAPNPPRKLRRPTKTSWQPVDRPLKEMRVSMITSAAIREMPQRPFPQMGDTSHRRIASDPAGEELCLDHRSPVGKDARKDPEVVFPRRALWALAEKGIIGSIAPYHFAIYGGVSDHERIERALAPALARQLVRMRVNLALMVPY